MSHEFIFFSVFLLLILFLLFVDLGLFSRKDYHAVTFRESLFWTSIWIGLSILFYFFIRMNGDLVHGINSLESLQANISRYHGHLDISGLAFPEALTVYNHNLSLQYITGYIIEYSLSMDNVFVILLIFISFNVPKKYYKRVLFWGILGAIVMRFLFIFILSALIYRAEWMLYIFGLFLIITAAKMAWDFLRHNEKKIDVEHHPMVRFAKKIFPVHPKFEEHKFWLRKNRRLYITPLFLVLLVVEFSDVIFAVDSVPAIFAVTRDPYIVFFSNIFAIMGLRSLFFLISHFFNMFYYLKAGLAALLGFIGIKMLMPLINHDWKIDTQWSLIIILCILAISIIASVFRNVLMKKRG
jgi:tellurite resistance protein TerC